MSNTSKTKTSAKSRGKRVKTESEVAVTKTKFTPTPWRIDDYGYGYKIEPNICWIGETTSVPPEQLRANADLIAAAPEMYWFIKHLTTTTGHALLSQAGYLGEELYNDAKELCRKARGESEVSE